MRNVYKVYAGKEPVDLIWGICSFTWGQIIELLNIVDKDLTDADVHLKFVSTKSNIYFKNLKNNPSLCLVRF